MSNIKIRGKRKSFLTLIEILLVMTLILTVMGIAAFPIATALQKEKFQSNAMRISEKIRIAQDLMITMNIDVVISLKKQKESPHTIVCIVKPTVPVSMLMKTQLYEEINGIEKIVFEDGITKEIQQDFIELKFYAGGRTTPKGVLSLYQTNKNDSDERHIILWGSPRKVEMSSTPLTPLWKEEKVPYPNEITSYVE